MAEIFGAVASGIGIAGVAAQAIDGIRKLQTFCNDVRDAPEEIEYMVNELEFLLNTIVAIEVQIQRNASVCLNMDPTPALRFVRQSVGSLSSVIEKLNIEITHKRKLRSLKTAWKKKVLETYMVKIERSKTSLGLAVSAYSAELHLQTTMRTETRMDQLSVGITTLTASYSAHSIAICDSRLSKNQQSPRGQQLLIDNDNDWQRVRRRPMSLRPVPVLSLSLVLPQWLAQYSLQMSVCKAAQGWSLNIKPYRTMPYNNDLNMVIARGNDFDAFRSFFDSGQATVFDRNEHGGTILHGLALWAPVQAPGTYERMARFLIERGADANEPDDSGTLAIYNLSTVKCSDSIAKSEDLWNMDFLRLLVNETDLDPELFWNSLRDVFMPSVPFEAALKVIFPMDTMEYPTFTMTERLECLTEVLEYFVSPDTLANYLGIESIEAAYPTLEDSIKREITRVAINEWGHSSGMGLSSDAWEHTLRALFVAGFKLEVLHSQDSEGDPNVSGHGMSEIHGVAEMIRHFVGPYAWGRAGPPKRLLEARDTLEGFRYLVSRTDYLGIRLETGRHCGRLEICFDEDFMRWPYRRQGDGPCIDPHTLSLYYDDTLSTWVMWNSTYEEYCGEFWDLLEHPERTMPGTWVE